VFFSGFQKRWLDLTVEAQGLALEIPGHVALAVHRELPAVTLVQLAYAVSETRPTQPPSLGLVLNAERAGVREQPFFLVPPPKLELAAGTQGLGLTVRVGVGGLQVSAADPRFGRVLPAAGIPELAAILKDIHRRYPSKEAIVLVPEDGVTVGQLVAVIDAVRGDFPRIVLSSGQPIIAR
jgi:hypothetical protein